MDHTQVRAKYESQQVFAPLQLNCALSLQLLLLWNNQLPVSYHAGCRTQPTVHSQECTCAQRSHCSAGEQSRQGQQECPRLQGRKQMLKQEK